MELTLTAGCWITFCKWLAKVLCLYTFAICFIPLLVNRYYDRFLPLFRQFLLLPNRSNKFMNLQENCSTPCFNQFCRYLINNWRLFGLLIASSPSAALGSSTSGSAVCISACPTSLTSCTLNISHTKTNKCTNITIMFFHTQFVIIPIRFDLS